jgi:8-oxo-dGTP pyrophosphatase MutT (NUDIX family)
VSVDAQAWLREFCSTQAAVAEEDVTWSYEGAPLPLRIAYYVGDPLPPPELVTSVRALVVCGGEVLTMRNEDGVHVLPGGRREPGESFDETLRRELLEEAGCRARVTRVLGSAHLRHRAPKPPGYPFLYPDFLWLVYLAETASRDVVCRDDYELEARFEPVDVALRLVDLPRRVYIAAAGLTGGVSGAILFP